MINSTAKKNFSQFIKKNSQLIDYFKEGQVVKGRVLRKEKGAIYLDLGKRIGKISGLEFKMAKSQMKKMKEGDEVEVKIKNLEDEQGFVELSCKNISKQKIWDELKEIQEREEVLKVKINACNTGGLLTEYKKIPAFIPVSQLSFAHYPRVEDGDKNKILQHLSSLVGEELSVKIIDVNPLADKLVLSEKEAVSLDFKKLINKYKVGDVVEGVVTGLADFGVFIKFSDNPNIEGLIHISELDHGLVDNPKKMIKIGEAVKAKVTEIKEDKIFLSLKALKPNPWDRVEEKYQAGQVVEGEVYKFTPFGAFITLDENIHGLIHVSEFGSLDEMKKGLEQGKIYKFKISLLKPKEKRLILKLEK